MDVPSAPEIPNSDEKCTTTADPDSLGADLIELIAAKATSIQDFVRFGAVRRSWRSTTRSLRYRLDYQSLSPWMMFANNSNQSRAQSLCRFYSVASGEVFQFKLPAATQIWPSWGSPFGWIFIQDINKLFNPISGAAIPLPRRRRRNPGQSMVRALLTANPDSPDSIFFSIDFDRSLSYSRPGGLQWSHAEGYRWSDIIRFRGNLYGCLCNGQILLLKVSNGATLELRAAEFAPAPLELDPSSVPGDPALCNLKYLVDLGGDLCLVIRLARKTKSVLFYISTFEFQIYKLDMCTKKWERLLTLDGKCIFVGANYSYSVRASSTHLKPNCVYFSDDFCGFMERATSSFPRRKDMGIYHVGNGQVTGFTSLVSESYAELHSSFYPPVWFSPTIESGSNASYAFAALQRLFFTPAALSRSLRI